METQQIISLGEVAPDVFAESQDPGAYEEHELINDSIRGPSGAVVRIHKNDLAILRANKLIADVEAAPVEEVKAPAKGKKAASQTKAEVVAPVEPEPDLPALPNIADLPGA